MLGLIGIIQNKMVNKEKIPLFAFTGPEGSGKSSQAKLLAQELKLPHISTGDILRDTAINDHTELGDIVRKMFAEHVYLAPALILQILAKRLQEPDAKKGAVLDGGLRTIEETEGFTGMLDSTGKDFSVNVIYIRIAEWLAVERLLKRKGRTDDDEGAILSRLNEFHKGLRERIAFIRNTWGLNIIDGNRPVNIVRQDILEITRRP